MNCHRLGCWDWKIQNGIQKVWHKGLLFFAVIQSRLFFNILFMKGLASRCYKKPMKFIQGAFGSFFNARIVFKKDRWRWVLCTYVYIYIYKINGWYLFASLLVVGVYNLCCILRTRTFFSHHNSSQHDLNLGRDDNGSMFYPWGDDALWRTLVFKWLESTNYKWFLS